MCTLRSAKIRPHPAGTRAIPLGLDGQELVQRLLAFAYRGCFLAGQEPAAASVVGVARHKRHPQIPQCLDEQAAQGGFACTAWPFQRHHARLAGVHAPGRRSVFPAPDPPATSRAHPNTPPAPCTMQASRKKRNAGKPHADLVWRSRARPPVRTACARQTAAKQPAATRTAGLPVAITYTH